MEKDFELLPEVGAHQTLHVDEQVMGAGRCGGLLLTMPMFHLQKKRESGISTIAPGFLYLQLHLLKIHIGLL